MRRQARIAAGSCDPCLQGRRDVVLWNLATPHSRVITPELPSIVRTTSACTPCPIDTAAVRCVQHLPVLSSLVSVTVQVRIEGVRIRGGARTRTPFVHDSRLMQIPASFGYPHSSPSTLPLSVADNRLRDGSAVHEQQLSSLFSVSKYWLRGIHE